MGDITGEAVGGDIDGYTYHVYSDIGTDPKLRQKIPTNAFLDLAAHIAAPMVQAVRSVDATSELWVGETAAAWHSGQNGTTNAFVSGFWCVRVSYVHWQRVALRAITATVVGNRCCSN